MQKKKYIEFIRHRLAGGKPVASMKRKFHDNVIAIAIEDAMNDVLKEVFKKDPSQLNVYAKQYSSVAVSYDSGFRTFKATLPDPVVQLNNNSGIRWVVDTNYPGEHLIPLSRDSSMNFTNLFIDRNDDNPSYYLFNQDLYLGGFKRGDAVTTGSIVSGSYYIVDGDDITYDSTTYHNSEVIEGTAETDFTGDGTVYDITEISTLDMSLLVPFSELADTDQFIRTSGQNRYIQESVFRYFDLPMQDLINDAKSE